MKRKRWITAAFLILTLVAAGCSVQETTKDGSAGNDVAQGPSYGEMFLSQYPTLETALEETGAIVEVKKTGRKEDVTRDYVNIALTEVEIKRVLMGDGKLDDRKTIRIFELAGMNMTDYDKDNDRYLLFLHPQNSSLGDDVYGIAGVYQGLFKLKGGKLVYDADKRGGHKHAWHAALDGASIEEAEKKIKAAVARGN